jgi:hypothetical protein
LRVSISAVKMDHVAKLATRSPAACARLDQLDRKN